jgi:chromosome segregation ATPase
MNSYLYAARRPLALMVLLTTIIAGLIIYTWLLPVGLLAYGLMVVMGGRDPALAAASQRAPRPRLTSKTFRTQLASIERTQQEIERSVSQTAGPVGRLLVRVSDQARDLVEEAYTLCEKGQVIEDYLARVSLADLQQRINATDRQIASSADTYTIQQLQETRLALAEKQRNAADLTTYIGRIQAQLQSIQANLENVLAETVRLRTADAVSADSMTNQVAQRLSDLKSDMAAFQRVLDSALAGTGAP